MSGVYGPRRSPTINVTMEIYSGYGNANSPTLKRSFLTAQRSQPPSPSERHEGPSKLLALPDNQSHVPVRKSSRTDWHFPLRKKSTNLGFSGGRQSEPKSRTRTMQAPLPSFMSVIDNDTKMNGMDDSGRDESGEYSATDSPDTRFPSHQHTDSNSSTSTSTDSSPTSTVSTIDSSSLSDPSPGSFTDSPVSIVPLSFFASKNNGVQSSEDLSLMPPTSPLASGFSRPISPSKKGRNGKGLSLNLGGARLRSPPAAMGLQTGGLESTFSAPPTPAFIIPPPPKRKPSKLGLSIKVPVGAASEKAAEKESRPKPGGLSIAVPPTPGMNRISTLRHHQSSPSLSLFSPTTGVEGGMRFPNEKPRSFQPTPLQVSTGDNTISSQFARPSTSSGMQLDGLKEEDYDVPLSQEVKSPSYPSGPVCIYDPAVYLYLEPDDKEASEFDVVFNVAREVRNPYVVAAEKLEKERAANVAVVDTMMTDVTTPDTAASMMSYSTAFEVIPESPADAFPGTPTTPKAKDSREELRQPEYIHIPWDHNTLIVDDLLKLVEDIDQRVNRGKKVLIHCQCGVSRSASLIIAYGMYKNPELQVQEAYDAVKSRSRWIGPNMSLIYQLSEFRIKMLAKKKAGDAGRGFRSWRGDLSLSNINTSGKPSGRSATVSSGSPTSRPGLDDAFDAVRKEPPPSAPLPMDRQGADAMTPKGSSNNLSINISQMASKQDDLMTPGPLSAPPHMWSAAEREAPVYDKSETPRAKNPSLRIESVPPVPSLSPAPTYAVFNPNRQGLQCSDGDMDCSQDLKCRKVDNEHAPSAFTLMSPVTTEFTSPFAPLNNDAAPSLASFFPPRASPSLHRPKSHKMLRPITVDRSAPTLSRPKSQNLRPVAINPPVERTVVQRSHSAGLDDMIMSPTVTDFGSMNFAIPGAFPASPGGDGGYSGDNSGANSECSSPSLMSPRTTEFGHIAFPPNPASHASPPKEKKQRYSIGPNGLPAPRYSIDPRSPATKAEAPVMRSIFDVL
jgi:tyrosine-protein phosphatase MSG5